MPYIPKPATPATAAANRAAVARYAMDDRQDFADADRGLIATFPDHKVVGADGQVIFDLAAVRLPRRRRAAPGHGEPEPVAAVAGDPPGRAVQGGRRPLPGAQQRHRQPDDRRGRRRPGHHRLHDRRSRARARAWSCSASTSATSRSSRSSTRTPTSTTTAASRASSTRPTSRPGKVPIIAPGTIASSTSSPSARTSSPATPCRGGPAYAFGSLLDRGPRQFVTCGIGIGTAGGPTISYISPTDPITETGHEARRSPA